MGTAVRPSFLTDRRDDMGVASFRNAACRKGRGKGAGGGVMSWLLSAAKESRLRTAEGGGARVEDVPWRRSALFCLPQ